MTESFPEIKSNVFTTPYASRRAVSPGSASLVAWVGSILCRCVMQLLNLIRALCCRCYRHWPSAAHKCHRNIFLKKTNNAHTHTSTQIMPPAISTSTIACLTYPVAPCRYSTYIVVKILSVDMHKNPFREIDGTYNMNWI